MLFVFRIFFFRFRLANVKMGEWCLPMPGITPEQMTFWTLEMNVLSMQEPVVCPLL